MSTEQVGIFHSPWHGGRASARFFAILPQKPCTFPTSITVLVGKTTVYNAYILKKRLI
jgi:hypothetical protein